MGTIPANLLLGDILGLPMGSCISNMFTNPNFSKASILLFSLHDELYGIGIPAKFLTIKVVGAGGEQKLILIQSLLRLTRPPEKINSIYEYYSAHYPTAPMGNSQKPG
jgi:hypothetical protein